MTIIEKAHNLKFLIATKCKNLTDIDKVKLIKLVNNNPNLQLEIDFVPNHFGADMINNNTLLAHFKKLQMQGRNHIAAIRMCSVLAQVLPKDLAIMTDAFAYGNNLDCEIKTLERLFPERENIIKTFEDSNQFKDLSKQSDQKLQGIYNDMPKRLLFNALKPKCR